jgi:hypothetical protein
MNPLERIALLRSLALHRHARRFLGERNWFLLRSYGKVMSGPYAGLYVSGVPTKVVRNLLHELQQGKTVPVHLMHKHVSGNYEASELKLVDGRFVMAFFDREESA